MWSEFYSFWGKRQFRGKCARRWLTSSYTGLCLNPAFIKSPGKVQTLNLTHFVSALALHEAFGRQRPKTAPELEASASAALCPEFQLFLTFSPGKPSVPLSPLGPTLPFSPWKQSHLDKCCTGRMEKRFLQVIIFLIYLHFAYTREQSSAFSCETPSPCPGANGEFLR